MARLKLKEHLINRDWCKGCGICVHFCPKKVLEIDSQEKVVAVRPEDCICCKLCELRCPDLAIEVVTEQPDQDDAGKDSITTNEDATKTSEASTTVSKESINTAGR
ncbi:MAG: ferredoxin family protein [Desulfamplus sp.]|nr:ferredoxin family protein [Desulfamplus sp.]